MYLLLSFSPRVSFLLQHSQQSAATSASQQLELSTMASWTRQELNRQDTHMDKTRQTCQKDMDKIANDMKKVCGNFYDLNFGTLFHGLLEQKRVEQTRHTHG